MMDAFSRFRKALNKVDFSQLPGLNSHLTMAPDIRKQDIIHSGRGQNPVQSSVLILLYPGWDNLPHIVFIQRPAYPGVHGGQISFPGGRYEEFDNDLKVTALRETYEEVGVSPDNIEVLGALTTLYIPPSNYIVSPFVGMMDFRPDFVPDPKEVDEVLEIGLHDLLSPSSHQEVSIQIGRPYKVPCFLVKGKTIWGATAMMLKEFLDLTLEVLKEQEP